MKPEAIKGVSSLHIYGVNDVLIKSDRTLKLAAAFENPTVVSHPGGHFTPNTWPTRIIKQFLIDNQNKLSTKNLSNELSENLIMSEPLSTFESKIEATISYHSKQLSKQMAFEQKQTQSTVIPIGLVKPMDLSKIDEYIEEVDQYPLDDIMLLVWCKRSVFYKTEPTVMNAEKQEVVSKFFEYWMKLFLLKTDELLSNHLKFIWKYGSWADLKTLYAYANQLTSSDNTDIVERLNLLKNAIVQIFGEQLKLDHQTVLKQPDECANEYEDQNQTKQREWISHCAKQAPRISNNRHNINTSKQL